MNFCESCGAKLEKNVKFCEACGAKVPGAEPSQQKVVPTESSVEKKETRTPQNKKVEVKPLTKQQKIIGASIIGLLVFLFVGYKVGESVYSQENQTDRIIEALSSKDAAEIAKVVHSEDSNFEVTEENLEGFASYLEESPEYLSELIGNINTTGQYKTFHLRQNGKKMGLYDSYELILEPVYGEIYINHEDITVSANGEELFVSNEENYRTVGPFAPGIITFTAEGEVSGFPLTTTEETTWLEPDGYNSLELTLSGFSFDVYSELEHATVYIDDKEIGELENGSGYFGPIQVEEGMQLHIAQTLGEDEIVSEKVDLTEDQSTYEFYDLVLGSESTATATLGNLYQTTSQLGRNYDSYTDDLNAYFHPDGPAYGSYRTELLALGKMAYDNDEVSYIDFDVTYNEVERTGANTFVIEYEVSYNTRYSYNSDKEDGLSHYEKEATIVFEPTNHPNRDFDVYVYEVANEELIYEEGQGITTGTSSSADEETEETEENDSESSSSSENAESADASDEDSARAAASGFVQNLATAVNDDNFSAIASYIDPASSFYSEQSAYITNTHNSGITERLDSHEITNVSVSGDTAKVTVDEVFTIWNNGSESQASYTAIYDLKKVDGDFLITKLAIE